MRLYHPKLDRYLADVHPLTAEVLAKSGWVQPRKPRKRKPPAKGDPEPDTPSEEE
jgi:hypothetical protein